MSLCFLLGGLLACIALEVFDLLAGALPSNLGLWKKGAVVSEAFIPFFWLGFSLTFARNRAIRGLSLISWVLLAGSTALPVFAALTPVERFFYSPDFVYERMLFLGRTGYFFYIALLFLLAVALYHLERTLVALPRGERFRVKFELVGAGAILAVLVVYYSQALLYRSIDMNLIPVRSAVLTLGVGLMGFSRLRGGEANPVRVSRDMAYRSLVVLAVGCYLVGLGLFGEGMRYLDASLQRSMFIFVALLGGLGVVLVLLSEKARRKVKVFLHKHFYRTKFDYRKEWLKFTGKQSSARSIEEMQEAILDFYCETFAFQSASLYLRTEDGRLFVPKARYAMDGLEKVFPWDGAFALYLADRDWVFNLADKNPENLREDERFFRKHGISLAVPLLFEKNLEGIVFLGGRIDPDEVLSYEDYDLMKVIAHQTTSSLLSLKLTQQLSTAQEMAAIGKVSAFVMHDLKNLVSNLALVVDNAKDFIDDPEFQEDMVETLESTVTKMKGLIAKLKNMEGKASLNFSKGDLQEVARDSLQLTGRNGAELCGESVMAYIDVNEIQQVILNLVTNAREAGDNGQTVRIEVGQSDRMAFVRVADKGCGMSEEYIRAKLFRPFSTTKKKGFGIGLYQCKQVVEAHGGRIDVESREGEGTTFTVWLPLAEDVSLTTESTEGYAINQSAS